ncbi:MAG TPA: lysylphosphatidylglycerol synthase transmembrane domain-containing protein [Acidimicrobiales bacterium]|nr:lysylphosphatidylglycerol synthase transmembrane domain-containing protein [Acidimicrobiales bacterium]
MASILGTVPAPSPPVPGSERPNLAALPQRTPADLEQPRVTLAFSVHSWAPVAGVLLGIAMFVTLAVARRHAFAQAGGLLGRLRWVWIPVAIGLEWVSIAVFARMQRKLLRAGGATIRPGTMLSTVYAANALSSSIPLAGPELGAIFTFRRFRRHGVEAPIAGWALMVGGIVAPVAGTFVLMAGALLSGNDLLSILGVVTALFGGGLLVAVHGVVHRQRWREAIEPIAGRIVDRGRRLLRRPTGDARDDVGVWLDDVARVRATHALWLSVGALALINWLADAAVLAASIYAVGAAVPWQALLLVYGSGVVVRSLGVTPGGLGLVEGTLCVGLIGAGIHAGAAVASVLLYRVVSFWLVGAAGWVAFAFLRREHRRVSLVAGQYA